MLSAGRLLVVKPCVIAVQLTVWLFRLAVLSMAWTLLALGVMGRGVTRLAYRDETRRRAPRRAARR